MSTLVPVLEAFFTQRLAQRRASPHTVASYRDTWRLLLVYAKGVTGKEPSKLDIADLDATLIAGFLDYLEHERGNGISTSQPTAHRHPLHVCPCRPALS